MFDADAQALRERRSDGEYLLPAYDDWCFSRIPGTVADLPGADAGPRLPAEATDGYDGVSRVVVHRDLGVWYGDEDGGKLDFVAMHGGLHPDEMLIPFATATIDSLR
ncbi:hypothetical protein [Haloferax volcanii]|uniref:Phosphodiesterase/nucleotide pyrophosphatase domain protein-like protein n=3 Tax=Haloferax volcanii TaxID=2246 RepID=A0A8E8PJ91_HALVD|nr:hypothetical protein [Haloferax volcanii]ELY28004.1 type I phosphodiesterase/nucleotide pyrophosphatase [Haloferax volcanii DS2]MBS8117748.1 nucleotide pyrophosphatase [Haloferax volcanii]MBS8122760.1 nucleotide pyrophosphatase [Haloferax volcanii]MBS8126628.1 nucleotide pyrophosphatase [Haloferax volcanii]MBS8130494.1 nucleotide pyrophosphatase [Haloferax volcanii]